MFEYKDRTWCGNEKCNKYDTCKNTYKFAYEEAKNRGFNMDFTLFSVCPDRECDEYVKKNKKCAKGWLSESC